MPAKCQRCGAPIFFLTTKPDRSNQYPKSIPIDVDPDPEGTIAVYEYPSPDSVAIQDQTFAGTRFRYLRRMYGYARQSYLRLGGVLFTVHFDTCPARNR